MKQYKGYRLWVNLGPSQVRRRLKGYGFGVKKVESAGTNQAVIIHTATGDHLKRLERLFADVIAPAPPPRDAARGEDATSEPSDPGYSA